jgi:hypothetical protein
MRSDPWSRVLAVAAVGLLSSCSSGSSLSDQENLGGTQSGVVSGDEARETQSGSDAGSGVLPDSGESASTESSPTDSAGANPDPANLALATRVTDEDGALITAAMEFVKQTCLAEFGYQYTAATYQDQPEAEIGFLYPSPEEVAANGYGWQLARRSAALDGGTSGGPTPEQLADPEFERALNDVCGPRGTEAVGWSEFARIRQQLSDIQDENAALVESDERVNAVVQEWSTCMNQLGYDFHTPQEANGYAESLPGGPSSDDAIVVAIKDYECRRSVSYAEVRKLVREELNTAWLERNPTILVDLASSLTLVRDRAKAILGE